MVYKETFELEIFESLARYEFNNDIDLDIYLMKKRVDTKDPAQLKSFIQKLINDIEEVQDTFTTIYNENQSNIEDLEDKIRDLESGLENSRLDNDNLKDWNKQAVQSLKEYQLDKKDHLIDHCIGLLT